MFLEEIDLHRQDPFENNFKEQKCCSVTRANMNEPSMQRTSRHYNCSVTYVTQQSTSSHENF